MLIDRKHKPWVSATCILALGAAAGYYFDPQAPTLGHGGETIIGLCYGVAAYAIMIFCAALGLKRRVPHWRLGSARSWLRAHVWLGILCVWIVALHAAFSLGGPLTTVLWALIALVTLSALVGVILQQLIPRLLLHSVPGETVAQQLARQLDYVKDRMKQAVVQYAGSLDSVAPGWSPQAAEQSRREAAEAKQADAASPATATIASPPTGYALAAPDARLEHRVGDINKPPFGGEPLRRFYHEYVTPYLVRMPRAMLANQGRTDSLFVALRTMTPPHIHPGVDEMRDLVARHRLLTRQRTLMRVLFAWLLVHVPLSWALLVLAGVHAVQALRYLQW